MNGPDDAHRPVPAAPAPRGRATERALRDWLAQHPARRYGAGIVLAAVGVLLALAFDEALGASSYTPAIAAVLFAVLLAGTGPALLTTALCAVLIPFVAHGRAFTFADVGQSEIRRDLAFVIVALLVVAVGGRLEAARRRAESADEARLALERRFRLAQELSPVGFTVLEAVRDETGRIADFRWTYLNDAAGALLRRPASELLGARLLEVLPGNARDLFARYVRVVETGEAVSDELRYEGDGIHGWFVNTVVKVEDGVAVSFRDVTARREAEERVRLLADVAVRLDADPGLGPRLEALARLMVERVADTCVVDLRLPGERFVQTTVAARDPELERILGELPPPLRGSPRAQAMLSGRPQHLPVVTEAAMRASAHDEEDVERRRRLGVTSAVCLPLIAHGSVLGAVTLGRSHGTPRFDDDDLAFLTVVSQRAALALDNARLFEQQREVAATLQRGLIPRALPEIPGLDVAARYLAGGEGLEVGGDFYDVFEAGWGWLAVVGDVCGKGAGPARVTALVRHTLRLTGDAAHPADALLRADRALRWDEADDLFCTAAAIGIVTDPAGGFRMRLAVAGHPPPLILRAGGAVERIEEHGALLGVLEDPRIEDLEQRLGPGDALVLYTDGLVEARHETVLFGVEGLVGTLSACRGEPAAVIAERLEQAAGAHADGQLDDDCAVLVLRVRP
jgi:serine phosphatase RsbU (regulator of sigma subunit)/PAS domain-containing protein